MKYFVVLISLMALTISTCDAASKDDPLLTMLKVHKLDYFQHEGESVFELESDFWIGKDLDKFWLKTEIEQEGSQTKELELQALYSKAVAPYWDFQIGVRHDFKLPQERTWAVIGFHGLAPYYFEIDSALFIGKEGDFAARLSAEYEMMLTQQLELSPELEINFYGQDDPVNQIGSGISDASIGLRLKYAFVREFAFYIGFEHKKKFGGTARYSQLEGKPIEENNLVMGVSFWL